MNNLKIGDKVIFDIPWHVRQRYDIERISEIGFIENIGIFRVVISFRTKNCKYPSENNRTVHIRKFKLNVKKLN